MSLSADEAFAVALGDLARAWRDTVNDRLKPLGLNYSAAIVLRHLSRHAQGVSQIELARMLNIEGPTVLKLIDRLEKQGFVARRNHEQDRRIKLVVLTAKAGPLLPDIHGVLERIRQSMLADLDAAEIERLTDVLVSLRKNLDD